MSDPLISHRTLGRESIYRIVGGADDLIEVEVVTVPGLLRGTRLWLRKAAVEAMGIVRGGL